MEVPNISLRLFAQHDKGLMILRNKFETRLTMPLERQNILSGNIRGNLLASRPGLV